MKFLSLLRKQLKDDEIIDILEAHDTEVIYNFDRLHENIPDQYFASCKNQGIEFIFDTDQMLSTIFLYLASRDGFTPIAVDQLEDIQVFPNVAAVERHCSTLGLSFIQGGQRNGESSTMSWARIDTSTSAVHYEFVGQNLERVALMVDPPEAIEAAS